MNKLDYLQCPNRQTFFFSVLASSKVWAALWSRIETCQVFFIRFQFWTVFLNNIHFSFVCIVLYTELMQTIQLLQKTLQTLVSYPCLPCIFSTLILDIHRMVSTCSSTFLGEKLGWVHLTLVAPPKPSLQDSHLGSYVLLWNAQQIGWPKRGKR